LSLLGIMLSEEKLLQELIQLHENSSLSFLLHADKKIHHLQNVKISKSPTPVTKPTLRGGVYFSDTHEYKITGIIDDQTIIPFLSKTMLGPNTEFCDIIITTEYNSKENSEQIVLHTNLTNSMQSSSLIKLNLIIIGIEIKN